MMHINTREIKLTSSAGRPAPPIRSMASDRLRDLKAFDDTKAGVKGLVDEGVTAIPSIFHHPPESLVVGASRSSSPRFTIPVIDLAGLTTATAFRRAELVSEVKAAAGTVGFFQVVNHGVPEAAMSEMLAGAQRFHEEPVEAKRAYYSRDLGNHVRYRSNFDLFTSPAANWRDSLFLDMAPTGPAPEELPPACRDIVLDYTRLVQRLGGELLELLSEALGLHRGYLEHEAMCLEGLNVVCHYYPACPEPHLTMGTTKHSDPTFFTVLLQDAIGGLQVLVQDDKHSESASWVNVAAVPGALIVNIGDFLQMMSNDRFRSVEHRVVAKSVGPRVSVACFFRTQGAAQSTRVHGPIIPDGGTGRPRYRSTTAEEFFRHYRGKGLDGRSALHHFRL